MPFLALAVLGPTPNSAHHTIAAHDATKTVTLTGVVMQIRTRADEWQGFGTPSLWRGGLEQTLRRHRGKVLDWPSYSSCAEF